MPLPRAFLVELHEDRDRANKVLPVLGLPPLDHLPEREVAASAPEVERGADKKLVSRAQIPRFLLDQAGAPAQAPTDRIEENAEQPFVTAEKCRNGREVPALVVC